MDDIRSKFLLAKMESRKKAELEAQEDQRKQEEERQNVMKFWARRALNKLLPDKQPAQLKFDCQHFLNLTESDKQNFNQLYKFKLFRWYVLKRKLFAGDSFGHLALKTKNPERNLH